MKNLLILSTCHLHPLEAQKINEVSILYNEYSNLISITVDTIDDCNKAYLVCLAELLYELQTKHQVNYVLFDADEELNSEFKVYNW